MSVLSENIRYLRAQLGYAQQKVADALKITRGRYAKYEDASSEPPIDILLRMSRYYRVSIDLLVSLDLKKYKIDELLKLSDNRILLPVTVDPSGRNPIEIIPQKAKMGYLEGYSDPEYIESLQTLSLPFLTNGKYRAFMAEGDSMPPFTDGTYIIGRFVETVFEMNPGKTYVLVTLDGIVYKRLEEKSSDKILVSSDNTFFQPYEIPLYELIEIWEFACAISTKAFDLLDLSNVEVREMFLSLKEDIKNLEFRLSSDK